MVAFVSKRRVVTVFDLVLSEYLNFCDYLNFMLLIYQILCCNCLWLLVLKILYLFDR